MNTPGVLERSDTLNETWLDDELACLQADAGAAWKYTMKCCGHVIYFCDTHDRRARELFDLPMFRGTCGRCGHVFGWNPTFSECYGRVPI
jgi:hypothetical protein